MYLKVGCADRILDLQKGRDKKMYNYQERMKAVLVYEECGSATKVIRELGYPACAMLYLWIEEYRRNGKLHNRRDADGSWSFSSEEIQEVLEYYHTHGKSIVGTIKVLGYPGKETLRRWVKEARTEIPRCCKGKNNLVEYAQEQTVEAAIAYCTGNAAIQTVAKAHDISTGKIY